MANEMRPTSQTRSSSFCGGAYLVLVALVLLFASSGCSRSNDGGPKYGAVPPNGKVPEYSVAVHPLHNPAKLSKAYEPLIDYLNAHVKGMRFSLEASRDYSAFEEKYDARKPEFILPNPWQTLQAMKRGYHVVAMAGDPKDFKGLFVVRKDGRIKQPKDLKGKAVSYPAATALAACIMPQYFLYQHGINVNRDIENRYVGSQESSIMNVFLGRTAAGATWPTPWRAFQREHPAEAAHLKVAWETESLVNNSVMARDDVPSDVQRSVVTLLLGLDSTPEGRNVLLDMETARFIASSDKAYEVVRAYVDRFEKQVRKVADK